MNEPTLMDHEREQMLSELGNKNVEVFWMTKNDIEEHAWTDDDNEPMPNGWYAWICFPGCLPDTEPLWLGRNKDNAITEAWQWYVGDIME